MAETEDCDCPPVTKEEIMPLMGVWAGLLAKNQALPCLVIGRTRTGLMFAGPPQSVQTREETRSLLIEQLYLLDCHMTECVDVGVPAGAPAPKEAANAGDQG